MKILTYNILCGGDGRQTGENRRPRILALVKEAGPDILALQEANGFDDPAVLQNIADHLALPHIALSKGTLYADGENYNVALLSRYPMSGIHRFPECEFQSAVLSAVIETPFGPVSVCTAHLHAFKEGKRRAELSCLLAHQKHYQDQILLGDFNAISRSDIYPADCGEFELTYDVTDILNQHYVDLFAQDPAQKRPTFPTDLKVPYNPIQPRRIDYIYASESLSRHVTGLRVLDSGKAHLASDHFPLLAEFKNCLAAS